MVTSGTGLEDVDCYGVNLYVEGGTLENVSTVSATHLTLRTYPNERPEDFVEREIPLDGLSPKDFTVIHYRGGDDIRFNGLADLFWSELFRVPELLRWKSRFVKRWRQSKFNRKKFESLDRISFLRTILKHNKSTTSLGGITELMLREYGHEYFHHPQMEIFQEEARFMKNTLVEIGDLKEVNGFMITGQGYMAIVNFEEEERKHNESIVLQRRITYLTLVLAITGIATSWDQFVKLYCWLETYTSSMVNILSNLW